MKTRVFSSSLLSLMFMVLTNPVQAQWTTAGTDIYYSAGNVGINNAAPPVKLSVDIINTRTTYSGYNGSNVALMLRNRNNTANNFTVLSFANFGGNTIADITATNTNHSTHTGRLSFSTRAAGAGPQQRMLIDENGNVGIGTTIPGSRLDVLTNLPAQGTFESQRWSTDNNNYGLSLQTVWDNNGISQRFVQKFNGIDYQTLSFLSGNVGIGATSPTEKLDIGGYDKVNIRVGQWATLGILGSHLATVIGNNVKASTTNNNMEILTTNGADGAKAIKMQYNEGITFHTLIGAVTAGNAFSSERMRIDNNGNVGIGTTAPDAKLAVKGTIHTQEVRVDLNGAVAPDYVFEKDYDLMPLDELKVYLEANKHLPEVPSAQEMDAHGVNLKEMNLLLLKKVEELTLYVIKQNNRAEKIEKKNSELRERVVKLEKMIKE